MNIAFLSTAHIHTQGFLENINKAKDGRKTLLIWDDNPARGKRHAALAEATFEPELAKVLGDRRVDAFIICSENNNHLPLLRAAIPIGKPILCDKPLLTTAQDLPELKKLQEGYHTPLISGYSHPFEGEMQAAQEMIKNGSFGTITKASYRNSHGAAYGKWFDAPDLQWFTNREMAGGGALLDMGTHGVHLLLSFFGPVKEVWAEVGNYSGIYPTVDDFGLILMRFESGMLGQVESSWIQTGGPRGLEIMGSKQSLWKDERGYVTGNPPQALPARTTLPDRVDRLVAVARHEIPIADLQADLLACYDSVVIIEAAYRAAKAKSWIFL